MAKDKWRITAPLQGSKRELLLRMFRPRLARVYCHGITYAYGVRADYQYPTTDLHVAVIGIHRTATTEALVCTVNGDTHRPDGKRFHITLSTADGVPPAQAGDIDEANIESCSPVRLSDMRLSREMLRPGRHTANPDVKKAA